jgi:hypothetical protein
MRAVVWWVLGTPYVFALMLAPAAFVAGIVALPLYLWGSGAQIAFVSITVAVAAAIAVYLTSLAIQNEKEIEDGGTY